MISKNKEGYCRNKAYHNRMKAKGFVQFKIWIPLSIKEEIREYTKLKIKEVTYEPDPEKI